MTTNEQQPRAREWWEYPGIVSIPGIGVMGEGTPAVTPRSGEQTARQPESARKRAGSQPAGGKKA